MKKTLLSLALLSSLFLGLENSVQAMDPVEDEKTPHVVKNRNKVTEPVSEAEVLEVVGGDGKPGHMDVEHYMQYFTYTYDAKMAETQVIQSLESEITNRPYLNDVQRAALRASAPLKATFATFHEGISKSCFASAVAQRIFLAMQRALMNEDLTAQRTANDRFVNDLDAKCPYTTVTKAIDVLLTDTVLTDAALTAAK